MTASTPSTARSSSISASERPSVDMTRMSMRFVPSKFWSAASFMSGAVMRKPA